MNGRYIFMFALAMCAIALPAQEPRRSPHETASVTLGGKEIKIDYGRPSLRGRKAVGGTLVPYEQVWRTGADEATMLTTPVDLKIGELTVPAGTYSLFTLVTQKGWTLIVNKTASQWGAFNYDRSKDLGRVPMEVSKTPSPVEKFTIAFNKSADQLAILTLSWENAMASVKIAQIAIQDPAMKEK